MSGMSDGVSKYWLMSQGLGGGLEVHGEKTLLKMVEHIARVVTSRSSDWREAIADARAAVAAVEADCLHDERRDAILDVKRRVVDELWRELGAEWVAEVAAHVEPERNEDGDLWSRRAVDHVAAEERLGRYLEEKGLDDLYDEAIADVRDALDSRISDALWNEREIAYAIDLDGEPDADDDLS